MENEEALRKFTNSHLSGDWSTFDELATDDFVLIGPSPEPLDKVAFLMWLKSAYEANDNIDNNLTVVESTGDTLRCTVQMEGTHTRDWDLSFLGLGVIGATNVRWKNPREEMTATMRDGKVSVLEVAVPEGGGIAGILRQLGVGIPH